MGTRVAIFGSLILGAAAARAETFTDTGAPLTGIRLCSAAWGDYDNDGDLDLLFAGNGLGAANRFAAIAKNDGGAFAETDVGFDGVTMCSVGWGDYDGDGDLDAAISGSGTLDYITRVYGNEGSDVFSDIQAGMAGYYNCSVAWGDHDLDGDVDVALAGYGPPMVCTVFRNEGDDNFTDNKAGMKGIGRCSVAWGDYDSDGDLDLLAAGREDGTGDYLTRIYSNTAGVMEDAMAGLAGVSNCGVGWADYDNDGDLDLAICGYDDPAAPSSRRTTVYENAGGSFSVHADLTGVSGDWFNSSLAWGDYDADGDPDLVTAGHDGASPRTIVYRNDAGTFNVEQDLQGVYDCSVAWGDFDGDGDLDLAVAGDKGGGVYATLIFRCNVDQPNSAPSAPGVLAPDVQDQDVSLSWTASTDTETPQPGLTYNLRVGTAAGLDDIMSSMSDPVTGKRLVPAAGNARHNFSWTLLHLSQASYYWAVQAVDPGFGASGWTEGASFGIIDTTRPTVVSSDPYDGETQVATDRLIRVTFSEPMDKSGAEAAFSTSPIAGGSFSWIGNTLIFTASPALSDNTGYTVTIAGGDVVGAPDLAGNRLVADHSFWFKTPDETPPTVDSTVPGDGAADVAPAGSITVTFSEEMNHGMTQAAFSTDPAHVFSFSWSGPSMSAHPLPSLADETAYTVTVAGTARDASGNDLDGDGSGIAEGSPTDDYSFSFTTGDYTAPSSPADFAAAAQGTDSISLSWSFPVEPDCQGVVILRSDSGWPSYVPTRAETFLVGQTYNGAECVHSGAGTSLDDSALSQATHYYYAAYSFDDDGNYSPPAAADAETSAVVLPSVVSTIPQDGAKYAAPGTTVEATFSKPMDQTATEGAFSIVPAVAGAFSWNGDTLVFTPDEPLEMDQSYAVTISTDACDLDTNHMPAEFAFSFTVSEHEAGGGCGGGGCGAQAAIIIIIALSVRSTGSRRP